jgi:transposase-like protein
MNTTAVKTRRLFDETFKREAIQNWLNSGKSLAVIAQEPGLKANRLCAWRKRFAPADAGGRAAAGAKPGFRWPMCKASWRTPCARTDTCERRGTF